MVRTIALQSAGLCLLLCLTLLTTCGQVTYKPQFPYLYDGNASILPPRVWEHSMKSRMRSPEHGTGNMKRAAAGLEAPDRAWDSAL